MSKEEDVPLGFLAIMGVKIKGSLFLKSMKSIESVGSPFIFFPPAVLLK